MNFSIKTLVTGLMLLWIGMEANGQQLQTGDNVPDFNLQNLSGDTVSISDFRGHIVLLTFFATWCAPCVVEMPLIEKEIWQPYRNRGVKVLAIDQMESPLFVADFISAKGITYETVIDKDGSVTRQFIERLPHNTLIDPDGKIVHTAPGLELDRIRTIINDLLVTSRVSEPGWQPPETPALTIFPNPYSLRRQKNDITFVIDSPKGENWKLQIYNTLGRKFRELTINRTQTGRSRVTFSLQELALPARKGIYFVRYSSNGQQKTEKLIIID